MLNDSEGSFIEKIFSSQFLLTVGVQSSRLVREKINYVYNAFNLRHRRRFMSCDSFPCGIEDIFTRNDV